MSGYVTGVMTAARRGRRAAEAGEPSSVNPYKRGDYRLSWQQGWEAAFAKLRHRLNKIEHTKTIPESGN